MNPSCFCMPLVRAEIVSVGVDSFAVCAEAKTGDITSKVASEEASGHPIERMRFMRLHLYNIGCPSPKRIVRDNRLNFCLSWVYPLLTESLLKNRSDPADQTNESHK